MTIKAVTGFPGTGKTFYLTHQAYLNIKQGRDVFSNYPIRGAYEITFDDLVNYRFPKGSLVVIDESGRWFNSRNWSKLPSEVFDLFTLHRHAQLDLLIAVQNFNRIDVALREVIEMVYWSENPIILPYFKYYLYYDVEQIGGLKEYQSIERIYKRSRSRKLYDTHVMERIFEGKDEIPKKLWNPDYEVKSWRKRLYKLKMDIIAELPRKKKK